MAIVTGWGRVEEKKPTSNTLRKVAVPIMSMEECSKAGYSTSKITDNMMCAGYPQGERDACQVSRIHFVGNLISPVVDIYFNYFNLYSINWLSVCLLKFSVCWANAFLQEV